MNEFVATVNDKKIKISFSEENKVIINEKEFVYNFSRLNSNTGNLKIDNKSYLISVVKNGNSVYTVTLKGRVIETKVLSALQEKASHLIETTYVKHSITILKSPMPGMIIKINKKNGEEVTRGDSLLILEAMKMENDIRSPVSGRIKEIKIKEGEKVEKGIPLLLIE